MSATEGLAELDGRLMGQTTKHDMGHAIDLVFGSLVKHRVVVAMHRRPPGRHAIHQLTTIFQRQRTLRALATGKVGSGLEVEV